MRHHLAMTGAALGVTLGALAGCSSTPDPGPVFNDEGGRPVTCLAHQTEEPGARYTDPGQRNTGQVLAMLRYYTAHGTKPYCDGVPAGDTDQAWTRTYVDLGGAPDRITGASR